MPPPPPSPPPPRKPSLQAPAEGRPRGLSLAQSLAAAAASSGTCVRARVRLRMRCAFLPARHPACMPACLHACLYCARAPCNPVPSDRGAALALLDERLDGKAERGSLSLGCSGADVAASEGHDEVCSYVRCR